MAFFKNLFGKHDNSEVFSDGELAEAGVCPNCWGKQEYEGKFTTYLKDKTKSNINHDKENRKAFIEQFIEDRVTGIRLKNEGEYYSCPACSNKFK